MTDQAERLKALVDAGEMLKRLARITSMPARYSNRLLEILEHYPSRDELEHVAKYRQGGMLLHHPSARREPPAE